MTNNDNKPQKIGRIMWLLVWGLALILLTWLFQQKLERDYNPNQQVQLLDSRTIVLDQNRHGHYLANGAINGQPVVFLLDTGATQVALSGPEAKRLGLPRGPELTLNTAAGRVTGYHSHIKTLSLGPLTLYDLDAVIVPGSNFEVLLGMNALRQFELTQRGDRLTIKYLTPE
ncbi:retropepsin-like aspartic protease family protein [Zobellella endophytica]|nr:retropepsin-like aspartic protease [Zobellella endophytica]